MTRLDEALMGVTALGFDTSPFIYFIERHPAHVDVMREVIRRVDVGEIAGFCSVITLTEVMTRPMQMGDRRLEHAYRSLLQHSRHFALAPIDEATAYQAAVLRARYKLRTPDALQMAAAIRCGCQAFITNDQALTRVQELRVLLVEEMSI